jgi:hypothetical protein
MQISPQVLMGINECKPEHEETLELGLRKTPVEIRSPSPVSTRLMRVKKRVQGSPEPLILELCGKLSQLTQKD